MKTAKIISYGQRLRRNPDLVLREASLYFNQQGDLYKTLQDLTQRLDEANIPRRDLADVQDLIRVLHLDKDFGGKLDAGVRGMYDQLWQEAQEEDILHES